MGLIGAVVERGIRVAVVAAEIVHELTDIKPRNNPLPPHHNPELWSGADDLWPAEPVEPPVESPEITDTASEPELIVHQQWGLRTPDGNIMWGAWKNVAFDSPMDRVLTIANLQKTAQDCGFSEGEQTEAFLSNYGWVTRNQIATVVYEDTGAYALTDPEVCAPSTPVEEIQHEQDDGDPSPRLDGDIRPGPVGGGA